MGFDNSMFDFLDKINKHVHSDVSQYEPRASAPSENASEASESQEKQSEDAISYEFLEDEEED